MSAYVFVPIAWTSADQILDHNVLIDYLSFPNNKEAWSSTTTYDATNDFVYYGVRRYRSLQNGNLNKIPPSNPTWWEDVGWAFHALPFDRSLGTAAYAAQPTTAVVPVGIGGTGIAYALAVGESFTHIVLYGLSGSRVNVWVFDGDVGDQELITYQTVEIDGDVPRSSVVITLQDPEGGDPNVPYPVSENATFYVEVQSPTGGGNAYLGEVLVGNAEYLGTSIYPTTVSDLDFSVVEENQWGGLELVPRPWSSQMDAIIAVPELDGLALYAQAINLRATAAVWIIDKAPEFEPTVIYGFSRRRELIYRGDGMAYLSLSLRGMV